MRKVPLADDVVVLDGEVADPTSSSRELFNKPWLLTPSVFCTYTSKDGYLDWMGDNDAPALLDYLIKFPLRVGFNHLRFTLGMLDGALIRAWESGGEPAEMVRETVGDVVDFGDRDPHQGMSKLKLRGGLVDLNVDIKTHVDEMQLPWSGRTVNLDVIELGMLGEPKKKRVKDVSAAWGQRRLLEVIAYCRYDVYRMAEIYYQLSHDEELKIYGWPKVNRVNELGKVVLRSR